MVAWNEVLTVVLARLLRCRHGARTRPGLSAAGHAVLDLTNDAALRGLCDELVHGVTRLDPRFTRVLTSVQRRDDAGVTRILVHARTAADEPAACIVRLSPLFLPEVHHAP